MATSSLFPSTRKTTHYGRLSRLLVDICPCLLRDILEQHCPLAGIAVILSRQHQLKRLLNASQKALLFPAIGGFTGTYAEFDLSLLYLLLRNICGIIPHRNGWGCDPDPLDRSVSANIERLRIARNVNYGHQLVCSVDDISFHTIWSSIRQSVVELEATLRSRKAVTYEDEVDMLERTTMDPENDEKYITEIEKQRKDDMETRKLIEDVKVEITQLQGQMLGVTAEVAERTGDITRLQTQISGFTSEEVERTGNIAQLQRQMLGVTSKGAEHTAEMTHLQGQMSGITEETKKQGNQATLLQKQVSQQADDIVQLQDQVTKINDTIPNNIQAQHRLVLETWQKDEHYFIETQAYKRVYETCMNNSCVTITGNSGAGKSAIAHHLALTLQTKGYTIVPVVAADEIRRYADPSQKQMFVFDDPVGNESLDVVKLSSLDSCNDILNPVVEASDIKIVFTCRKQVFHDKYISRTKCFLTKNVVDLHDKQLDLTEEEKNSILEMYTRNMKNKLSKDTKMLIAKTKCFNFPLLCRLFGGNAHFQKEEKHFFDNMFDSLVNELGILKERAKLQFCALVLCLLWDDDFDAAILDPFSTNKEDKVPQVLNACGLPTGTSLKEIQFALESLVNVYLIKEGSRYRFIHDTLYEATAYKFGQSFPSEILKHCSSSFIRERIRVSQSDEGHFIVIQQSDFHCLSVRITSEIGKGNFSDVFLNPLMLDKGFIKVFVQYLDTISKEAINKLFMEVETNLSTNCNLQSTIQEVITLYKVTLLNGKDVNAIHWVLAHNIEILFQHLFSVLFFFNPTIANKKRKLIVYKIRSLVSVACLGGNVDTVETLLTDVRYGSIYDVWGVRSLPTLHMAVLSGNVNMVDMIIKKGVDVNIMNGERNNKDGCSALYTASITGHYDTVALLLENGADINMCSTTTGNSPLLVASMKGHYDTVALLLENGADINMCNTTTGNSPLFAASKNGHSDTVALLLENGADINMCSTTTGNSPLFAASKNGHSDTVALLLENGADINMCSTTTGDSPLYAASITGHYDTVALLLENGADINMCSTTTGNSPLFAASKNGHSDTVALLLENGADINTTTGDSPLIAASFSGHSEVVKLLLQHNVNSHIVHEHSDTEHADTTGVLLRHVLYVNLCNKEGCSALYVASQNGHKETVRLLLQHKADVNLCWNGQSPLFAASSMGHYDTVALLLENGADINMCSNTTGQSPLFAASKNGHSDTVALLLENGADINMCSTTGFSPLIAASFSGHSEVVKLLLQHNVNSHIVHEHSDTEHADTTGVLLRHVLYVNLCNKEGCSALYVASQNGHKETVRLLLQHKADVNLCWNGQSPLFAASSMGHYDTVALLLENGADINMCSNTTGQSPLFAASKNGHSDTVALLLENGADINTTTGDSPLIAASFSGHSEVVKLLLQHNVNSHIVHEHSDTEHADTTGVLLRHVVYVNLCNKEGWSALYVASQNGHKETVRLLLQHKADVNLCWNGQSPLIAASVHGHYDTVALLLENGADINMCSTTTGDSPLIAASKKGHTEVVKHLLQYNANKHIINKFGLSALDYAHQDGYNSIVTLLRPTHNI